ncbi:NAD/FAD-utilizing enzyme [Mangrovimicrobium sediminis]|uniref:NAD/FAD-utilizing enzyme n=1 Tax=Mangrovimicrobium sediminis TaxID=2562682 RepID=A0A4Z0M5K0_9GAMM|nr:NAD/FAD-utilizing enzyme [Haliea sp. SAOS-164]TGD74648.1 NAD/FAD-utilizing enzyme [Haliea sp. SAOS-164]
MQRHFFLSDNLDELQAVEDELRAAGITPPQMHVLSEDDAAVERRQLHPVEAVLRKNVVRGTERGALIGLLCAGGVLTVCWATGIAHGVAWVPVIFLAVVLLGFCTWEGGLIGIQEKHAEFRRFDEALADGRHLLLVDVDASDEQAMLRVVAQHGALEPAGVGNATPAMVVRLQDRWARFLQLAP